MCTLIPHTKEKVHYQQRLIYAQKTTYYIVWYIISHRQYILRKRFYHLTDKNYLCCLREAVNIFHAIKYFAIKFKYGVGSHMSQYLQIHIRSSKEINDADVIGVTQQGRSPSNFCFLYLFLCYDIHNPLSMPDPSFIYFNCSEHTVGF